MSVSADLSIETAAWAQVHDLQAIVERAIAAAFGEAGVDPPPGAEISCLFCDDAAMRTLNAQWRGIDKPTNVLSFPAPPLSPGPAGQPRETEVMLGDIVFAFETIAAEAAAMDKSLDEHLTHLVVHGVLHLLGHDHEGDEEADVMERLESRAMLKLGLGDPYAEQPPADGR